MQSNPHSHTRTHIILTLKKIPRQDLMTKTKECHWPSRTNLANKVEISETVSWFISHMKILLRFGSDKPQKYYRFLTAYRWQILWHLPTNELVRQISDNWGVSLENIEILGVYGVIIMFFLGVAWFQPYRWGVFWYLLTTQTEKPISDYLKLKNNTIYGFKRVFGLISNSLVGKTMRD